MGRQWQLAALVLSVGTSTSSENILFSAILGQLYKNRYSEYILKPAFYIIFNIVSGIQLVVHPVASCTQLAVHPVNPLVPQPNVSTS
jgi:hypothetical protein